MASFVNQQRGMSLIEIMIALAISLIVILAILRAYVSVGHVSAETMRGAAIDANIMKGLLIADRILQGAGYNTTAAASPSYGNASGKLIQAYSGTTAVTVNIAADTIVWKLSSGYCQALKSTNKSLVYYGGAGYSCTGPALPATSLQPSQTLISTSPPMATNVSTTVGDISLKVIELASGVVCTPFGVKSPSAMPSGGKYYVQIDAKIYATSTSSTASTISNSTCLFNIVT